MASGPAAGTASRSQSSWISVGATSYMAEPGALTLSATSAVHSLPGSMRAVQVISTVRLSGRTRSVQGAVGASVTTASSGPCQLTVLVRRERLYTVAAFGGSP